MARPDQESGSKLGGYQINAIAKHFNRDPVVISQGIKRLEQKIRGERAFARAMTRMQEALIRNRSRNILI